MSKPTSTALSSASAAFHAGESCANGSPGGARASAAEWTLPTASEIRSNASAGLRGACWLASSMWTGVAVGAAGVVETQPAERSSEKVRRTAERMSKSYALWARAASTSQAPTCPNGRSRPSTSGPPACQVELSPAPTAVFTLSGLRGRASLRGSDAQDYSVGKVTWEQRRPIWSTREAARPKSPVAI
jgi:hypothetical protein